MFGRGLLADRHEVVAGLADDLDGLDEEWAVVRLADRCAAALAKLSYKGVGEAGIEPAVPERLIYSQGGSPDPAPPKYT